MSVVGFIVRFIFIGVYSSVILYAFVNVGSNVGYQCHAEIYNYNGVQAAIVKKGYLLDSSASLWVNCEGRWFKYYLDHDIFRWDLFSVTAENDFLIITKNGESFARYDVVKKDVIHFRCPDYKNMPLEEVWQDEDGNILCTIVGYGVVKRLTKDEVLKSVPLPFTMVNRDKRGVSTPH